jgi:hypothetical protein
MFNNTAGQKQSAGRVARQVIKGDRRHKNVGSFFSQKRKFEEGKRGYKLSHELCQFYKEIR